jgi:hypothetical protein
MTGTKLSFIISYTIYPRFLCSGKLWLVKHDVFEDYRSDIFRLENLSVWQIPVFRYGLLIRNRGYIEFENIVKTVFAISKEY